MKTKENQTNNPSNPLTLLTFGQSETPQHKYKKCCGECTGQGSCGNMTKVSFFTESSKDIAALK